MSEDARQMRYARTRFEYTSIFRAWFYAWSEYETLWHRIMLETPECW